jgi:tetratricopeptide (TPR) repeat protein
LRLSSEGPANQCWKAEALASLAYGLSTRARFGEAENALDAALQLSKLSRSIRMQRIVYAFLAYHYLNRDESETAVYFADLGWALCDVDSYERDFIHLKRLQGAANTGIGEVRKAYEQLLDATTRARNINNLEEGVPASISLAELEWRQGNSIRAREILEEIWESVERGPYPIYHADARNLLAQIERDGNDTKAALEAATKAYSLAWCEGAGFAYEKGLRIARSHIEGLDISRSRQSE